MFARKDIEHDVLSAYQRHRRQLKKQQQNGSQLPRTVPSIEDAQGEDAQDGTSLRSPTSSEADASYIYSPDRQELTDASSEQGQTAASTDSLPQQEEEVTERRASVSGKPKLVDVASPRRLSRPVSRITHCKASSADSRSSSTEQQLIDGQAEEGMQGNIGGISGIE